MLDLGIVGVKVSNVMYGVLASGSADINVDTLLNGNGAADGSLSEMSAKIQDFGQGGVTLAQRIGVYAIAIGIAVSGIGLIAHAGNAQKSAEAKETILPRLIGGILIFAAVGAVAFLQKIGGNLF